MVFSIQKLIVFSAGGWSSIPQRVNWQGCRDFLVHISKQFIISRTVEPGFWRREFLLIYFGGDELMQGLSTGRLAVRELQKDFDLSTGQLSR